MRLEVDQYGQLKHSDLIQVVARGRQLTYIEPCEIAKRIAELDLDPDKPLSEVWQSVKESLQNWFVGPNDLLIAVFFDGSLLMGGILLVGNHKFLTTRLILNAAETIKAYYGVADSTVEYFVIN